MARGGLAGWIKIGIGADSKDFDSKVKNLKNKISEADNSAKGLEESMAYARDNVQMLTKELDKVEKGLLSDEEIMERINKLAENGIDFTYEAKTEGASQAYQEELQFLLEGQTEELKEQAQKYEDINSKIDTYKTKLIETESEHYKLGDTAKKSLSNIGDSVEGVIKKFVKWGLAIIGIRSVISLIKRSVSTLSQYDEKLATDLEYIRFALAMALKPLIEWIVQMTMKAIKFINTLIYRLTGVNLLANATPKAFNETTKSLKKANKEVKELKKQLAGFDEMNILSDNTTKSKDDAIEQKIPSMDLSKTYSDEEFDDIIEKFKKVFNDIKEDVLKKLDEIKQAITPVVEDTTKKAKASVFGMFSRIFDKEYLSQVFDVLVKEVLFVINLIVNIIKDKVILVYEFIRDIVKMIIDVVRVFIDFLDFIGALLTGNKEKINKAVKDLKDSFFRVLNDIKNYFWDLFNNLIFKYIKKFIDGAKNLFKNFNIKINLDGVKKVFDSLLTKAKEAWNGIKKVFGDVSTFFKNTFSTAWTEVKKVFSTGGKVFSGITDGIVNSFKKIVNTLIDGIEKVITKPFEKINDILNDIRSTKVLGIKPFNFLPKNAISIPKMPRLATGGVINMPGRGVALGGELGPEGVIPMTNKSAMELLGRTIGEYVTINANITNNMNGRLISRVMREVNAQQDFLYNR